jgi:hypothetical protein
MSYPPIKNGTRVKTTILLSSEVERRNYQPSAITARARHNGATGVVREYHDSHGLCYGVEFDDGVAFYEPNELTVLATLSDGEVLP